MCGIAGIIHRGKTSNIGGEMTSMLLSMKHRGPDSSGYAVYGSPVPGELMIRFKVAEQEDLQRGFDIHRQIKERRSEVDSRIDVARRTDCIKSGRPDHCDLSGDRRRPEPTVVGSGWSFRVGPLGAPVGW